MAPLPWLPRGKLVTLNSFHHRGGNGLTSLDMDIPFLPIMLLLAQSSENATSYSPYSISCYSSSRNLFHNKERRAVNSSAWNLLDVEQPHHPFSSLSPFNSSLSQISCSSRSKLPCCSWLYVEFRELIPSPIITEDPRPENSHVSELRSSFSRTWSFRWLQLMLRPL